LSRQRFCLHRDGFGLLVTMLLKVLAVAFISCRLASVITTDNGAPFWSVRRCLFVPSLALSVGLGPVASPPKVPSQ
jgi:hypothetical protein